MSPTCSICLAALKEPVCIPCGHIYCTKCLSNHVNNSDDEMKSTCPTCRAEFSIVTPDLTYLPKKYHSYVVPSVRRVYLDSSGQAALKKKLTTAEEKLKKLEKDQEILLQQCEQLIAAAHAHAEGEKKARDQLANLERQWGDCQKTTNRLAAELAERNSLPMAMPLNPHETLDSFITQTSISAGPSSSPPDAHHTRNIQTLSRSVRGKRPLLTLSSPTTPCSNGRGKKRSRQHHPHPEPDFMFDESTI